MPFLFRSLTILGLIAAATVHRGTLAGAAPPAGPAQAAPAAASEPKATRTVGIVLYPRFELLDVYGPAEIFGNLGNRMKIVMVAQKAGPVTSVQGPQVLADVAF